MLTLRKDEKRNRVQVRAPAAISHSCLNLLRSGPINLLQPQRQLLPTADVRQIRRKGRVAGKSGRSQPSEMENGFDQSREALKPNPS